jgi:predicted membrane protein
MHPLITIMIIFLTAIVVLVLTGHPLWAGLLLFVLVVMVYSYRSDPGKDGKTESCS